MLPVVVVDSVFVFDFVFDFVLESEAIVQQGEPLSN